MMNVVFFLIESLKVCGRKTNIIHIFLREFVELDIDNTC
jgi:hypothetical protein